MSNLRTAGMLVAIPVFFLLAFHFWPMPASAEGACGGPATPIFQLWEAGSPSDIEGKRVTVEAVVTADFSDEHSFGGFYAQMPDQTAPDVIANRGIFVYAPDQSVAEGQLLRFTGEVSQFRGMDQLSRIRLKAVCAEGQSVKPREIELPLDQAERRAMQGMLVTLAAPAVVTGTWSLARYGVIKLADQRLYRPTQLEAPGEGAQTRARENAERLLRLDDASRRQFPEPVPWPSGGLSPDNRLRAGDQVHEVTGVLEHRYGEWRLQPVLEPRFERLNRRPDSLPSVSENELRIGGFNVENYFIGDGEGGGFPTERGASTLEAFERQEAKLLNAMAGLNADIIGLIEIENNGFDDDSAIARLASEAEGNWQVVRPDGQRLGSDAIKVGLLYDADRVETVGSARTLTRGPFAWGNRQPLAQRFRYREAGPSFRVVVNHFKSKICGGAEGVNADQGDGQGCWNAHRVEASEALIEWIARLEAETGNDRTLLIGDYNAYAREDPIQALEAAGYRNLVARFSQDSDPAHSFIFKGESGTLDYAFASPALHSAVREAGIWAINADEPAAFGYQGQHRSKRVNERLFTPGPWRSSDHDPVWLTIDVSGIN